MSGNGVKIRIGLEKPGVDPGLKEIDENLKHVGETASKAGAAAKPAIDSIGMSAKQTAFALRGMPAQFTDIFTSLHAGQAPLDVLLQQGGQLKDMFGGIGPAARAMGGYVAGLITPFTLTAGSIGALALAYTQGAEESAAFNRALILSGNLSGVTAGQLMDLSRAVADSSDATRGAVAEAMSAMAASGRIPMEMMADVTSAAVRLERVGGAAVAETVSEFEALAKNPVEAVLRLNEQYHFLTAAVYAQVKALADQGRETDAAALAQKTYLDVLERRIPALNENLGVLEKAWRGVKDGAKWAWDAMLGIGREGGLEEQLAAAEKKLMYMSRALSAEKLAAYKPYQDAQLEVESLKERIGLQKRLTVETAAANVQREAALKAAVAADRIKPKAARAGRAAKTADPELEAMFLRSDESQRLRKELEAELKAIEQANEKKARAQQIVTNYNDEANRTVDRIARQNELIGLSEREVKVREALYKVEDQAAAVRTRITEQIKDETDRSAALAAVDADLANKKLAVAEATRQAYDESRTFDAGWSDALSKYKDNATNAADTARNAFSGMADAMEGAIRSFVKNGKIDFESFGDAVINTLIDIQMQSLRTNVLAPLMNSGGNWLSGLFGGQSDSITLSDGTTFSANGNVFSDSPGLHKYVNTVQTQPTFFGFNRMHAFANGGVFAEAGPEAVMPLKRDASGRLGVSGNSAGVTVNVINNASGTKATQQTRQGAGGESIIDVVIETVKSAIASDIGSGGVVASAMEGQYGLNRAAGAWR